MSARSTPNSELKQALRDAEARLAAGARLSADELGVLRDRAEAAGPLSNRIQRRVADVVATNALRTRREPAGALEGFYDDIRVATVDARFSRARLTNAYLEAPRSLVAWRRTAAAACVLAAVAVAWAVSDDDPAPVRPLSQVERYALLDGVLERFDPGAEARGRAAPGSPLDVYEVGGPESGSVPVAPRRFAAPRARAHMMFFRDWSSSGGGIRIRIGARRLAADDAPVGVERN